MNEHLECNCDRCLLTLMKSPKACERQRGWESWYQRDAATLLTFIQRRAIPLHCMEHGEDILHDCFLIGFKQISSGHFLDRGISLCGYLVGIAKNRLYQVIHLGRGVMALGDIEVEDTLGLDIDESLYLEEVVNRVREACTQRSQIYQRVIEGVYVEGKSSDEVAAELDKSAGNIRAIAHRAVREIRDYLENQHRMSLSAEAIRACLEVI